MTNPSEYHLLTQHETEISLDDNQDKQQINETKQLNGDVFVTTNDSNDDHNSSPSLLNQLRLAFANGQSRKLFAFLCITLSFAFVEFAYGISSNSLSLISDACHMFFDCSALVGGLAASVITRWRVNAKYSYGYERAEVMGGFVNGLFLMFVAFFIISEAIERLFAPPDVQHDRVLVVSIIGLIVNLIGIFIFQHGGHGHTHGGHTHSHGHSHQHLHSLENDPLLDELILDDDISSKSRDCESSELIKTSPNQLMQGVLLHILADTLGSVGVIVSALLMSQFGWLIADPICSLFIGLLVALSVLPLLRDSTAILMQRIPRELDHRLPTVIEKLRQMPDVHDIRDVHFWTLCTTKFAGSLTVTASSNCDHQLIKSRVKSIFKKLGVQHLSVEFDLMASNNLNEINNLNNTKKTLS